MAANNKWDNLMQSFDNLQSANIDGLTQEDIETERNNANRVKNIATSESALKQAEALGIEPNTEDYNILIALKIITISQLKKQIKILQHLLIRCKVC